MKNDQNHHNENKIDSKSIYSRKNVIFILIAITAGLGLVAAIILISLEFNQIYQRSYEASILQYQKSNSTDSTVLSTLKRTPPMTDIVSTITITSTITNPTTITSTILTLPANRSTTLAAMGNSSVTTT